MWCGKLAQNAVCMWASWNLVRTLWRMRKCMCNCLCSFTMFVHSFIHSFILSFIHSIGMCRIWWFLAVLKSFFHSSLLCTLYCHPSRPTILPSSLTSSCHLFLGLPLNLVVPKFIYNTIFRILFSSILCMCPNQHNLFSLMVSIIVSFLTLA